MEATKILLIVERELISTMTKVAPISIANQASTCKANNSTVRMEYVCHYNSSRLNTMIQVISYNQAKTQASYFHIPSSITINIQKIGRQLPWRRGNL